MTSQQALNRFDSVLPEQYTKAAVCNYHLVIDITFMLALSDPVKRRSLTVLNGNGSLKSQRNA